MGAVPPYTPAQRAAICEKVIEGLRSGTPLTIICDSEGMPCDDTVRSWAEDDEQLARAIARARETGFDRIAMDALAIADTQEAGVIETVTPEGTTIKTEDMLGHRKLRIETRLKLLAKWDPKRYGERTQIATTDVEGNERPPEEVVATKIAALLALANERKAAGADLA